jgi:alpha-D-ribose 1-methylphosphonate 5-triphosphate synthase subunit PhnH
MKETAFNEVYDSQMTFRLLLDGMARPGKIELLNRYEYKFIPRNFNPHCLTILKTLCDNTSSFYSSMNNDEIYKYLEVNTGSNFNESDRADYIIFNGKNFNDEFLKVNKGTIEFPENSGTVIITVNEISQNKTEESGILSIKLTGPGIKHCTEIFIKGLDREYLNNFIIMNKNFPLGIDLLIVDNEGKLVCIPRTSKMEIK